MRLWQRVDEMPKRKLRNWIFFIMLRPILRNHMKNEQPQYASCRSYIPTKNQNHGIVKLQKWFTNFEILRMVTCDNARLLALSGARNPYPGNLGVIEEGALADLLVIEGNPLERIEVLENPHDNLRVIVKDGVVCKNTL